MTTRGKETQGNRRANSPLNTERVGFPGGSFGVKASSVVLITLSVAAAFMATALAFLFIQRSLERSTPTTDSVIVVQPITYTVSGQPVTSTTSLITPPAYEDLMTTQRTVLESTSRAVESINRTADLILTVNAFLFTLMTAAGAGALWKAGSAGDRANQAVQKATKAHELVRTIEQSVEELESRSDVLDSEQDSLSQRIENARQRLRVFAQEQEDERELAKKDRALQKRTLAMLQLDEHGMSIRSGDPNREWKAVSGVLEMSTREDDLIRRKAVKVLGSVEKSDERVIDRLEEMAAMDPARGVRQEARNTLAKLRQFFEETELSETGEEPLGDT